MWEVAQILCTEIDAHPIYTSEVSTVVSFVHLAYRKGTAEELTLTFEGSKSPSQILNLSTPNVLL